jgi:hypothetical protein
MDRVQHICRLSLNSVGNNIVHNIYVVGNNIVQNIYVVGKNIVHNTVYM